MLAVQRPSMGSSKPSNPDMAFGCKSRLRCTRNFTNSNLDSFDTNTSNFPFPSPTAPAPGPSLLDDNESKFLDSFFDGVSSDHFDYNLFTNAPDGAEAGFGWDELPPTFMGTSSSFGQQPQAGSHEVPHVPDLNFNNDINTQVKAESSLPPTTSADVLAAATLLQNGSNGRSHSMGDGTIFQGRMPRPPPNDQSRPQSMSNYPPSRPFIVTQGRTSAEEYPPENYFSDMIFGNNNANRSIRQRRTNQKMDIAWGSDAAFGTSQSFLSPNGDPDKEIERHQANTLETAFKIDHGPSSTTSRATSPNAHRRTKSLGHKTEDVDLDSRPRKRRKSKFQEQDGDDDDSPVSALSNQQRRRKPTKKETASSPTVESSMDVVGNKRRKSTAAGVAAAKAARENLTEDQKRENHIKSEQKRRTLIREGFEDLGELVPGLRGGGFSKSAVLIMAADWLEELIEGNRVLKGRVGEMEGRL